jgi:hypothetical protein
VFEHKAHLADSAEERQTAPQVADRPLEGLLVVPAGVAGGDDLDPGADLVLRGPLVGVVGEHHI